MHVSPLELIQTLVSAIGVVLALYTMDHAEKDEVVAIRSQYDDGHRRMIAARNVRVEKVVLYTQLCLFVVGASSLFLSPPPYTTDLSQVQREMMFNSFLARCCMTFITIRLARLSQRLLQERATLVMFEKRKDETRS